MDLHTWITQQVDEAERRARACETADWRHIGPGIIVDRDTDGWQHAPDNAVIASVAHNRIFWSTPPAYSPDADHIVFNDPDAVLRRCEADRRILARHRADSASYGFPQSCEGCGLDNWGLPNYEDINDCPELLDLAHALGLTEQALAELDRPQGPERPNHGTLPEMVAKAFDYYLNPPKSTSDVPAALRRPRWKP